MSVTYYAKPLTMAELAGKVRVYNVGGFDTSLGVTVLEPVIGKDFKSKKYALVGVLLDDFAVMLDDANVEYFYWLNVADFKDEFGDIEFSPDVIITDSPGEIRKYLRGLKL